MTVKKTAKKQRVSSAVKKVAKKIVKRTATCKTAKKKPTKRRECATPEYEEREEAIMRQLDSDIGYAFHSVIDNEHMDLFEKVVKFAMLGYNSGYKRIKYITDGRHVENGRKLNVKISVELLDYTKTGFPVDEEWWPENDSTIKFDHENKTTPHCLNVVHWETEKDDE